MLGFWILTLGLGGLAAVTAGRALALTWRPRWQIVVFMLLLALIVRFLHYALLGEPLLSGVGFIMDFGVLLCLAWLSFSWMRQRQMKRQYHWLTSMRLEKA